MKLWTFQSIENWQTLRSEGVLRRGSHMDGPCMCCDWMAEQLTRRVGSAPSGTAYPIWAWYKEDAKRGPVPGRQSESSIWEAERFVRLEIEIPDNAVLLSNYFHWENITFGFLLARNPREMDALERDIKSAGFPYPCVDAFCVEHFSRIDPPDGCSFLELCDHNRAAKQHQEVGPLIRQRWEFIFDPNILNDKLTHWGWLQAVFWEIRLEQVLSAASFIKGGLTKSGLHQKYIMTSKYKPRKIR